MTTAIAFGSVSLQTAEFNQLETIPQVSAYVAQRSAGWIALGLGLLLGAGRTYAGLLLIAGSLLATNSRS